MQDIIADRRINAVNAHACLPVQLFAEYIMRILQAHEVALIITGNKQFYAEAIWLSTLLASRQKSLQWWQPMVLACEQRYWGFCTFFPFCDSEDLERVYWQVELRLVRRICACDLLLSIRMHSVCITRHLPIPTRPFSSAPCNAQPGLWPVHLLPGPATAPPPPRPPTRLHLL